MPSGGMVVAFAQPSALVNQGPNKSAVRHGTQSIGIQRPSPSHKLSLKISEVTCRSSVVDGVHGVAPSDVNDRPSTSPHCQHTHSGCLVLDAPFAKRSTLVRTLAAVVAGSCAPLIAASPATAAKLVELKDGSKVEVFEHGLSLSIVALRGSVPAQWIVEFKQGLGKYAGFSLGQRLQIDEIFKELQDPTAKQSAAVADVASLGDVWLAPAIQQGLIQPIRNAESYRWWKVMPPRWRELVRRNQNGQPDPDGQVYGVPYRWGATLIAYRRDKLLRRRGRPIADWEDLLQPQLQRRVAFLDSSRELIGLALKSLGLSYNTCAANMAAAGVTPAVLRERVNSLRRQARLFSNRDHIRALSAGDVWAVVGWSQDLIGIGERSNNIEVIAPASGTALTADVWVVPTHAEGGHMKQGPSPLLPSWLEFGLMPARVASSGLKTGASPLQLPQPPSPHYSAPSTHSHDHSGLHATANSDSSSGSSSSGSGDAGQRANVLTHGNGYMPGRDALLRSEFLLPLDTDTKELYKRMLDDAPDHALAAVGHT